MREILKIPIKFITVTSEPQCKDLKPHSEEDGKGLSVLDCVLRAHSSHENIHPDKNLTLIPNVEPKIKLKCNYYYA